MVPAKSETKGFYSGPLVKATSIEIYKGLIIKNFCCFEVSKNIEI